MRPLPLPLFFRLFGRASAYAVTAMVILNFAMMLIWTGLLLRSIPAHTIVPPAGKLFILAVPLIMLQIAIDSVATALACEYSIFIRGQRLREELVADRGQRDADIAQTVLTRLAEQVVLSRADENQEEPPDG